MGMAYSHATVSRPRILIFRVQRSGIILAMIRSSERLTPLYCFNYFFQVVIWIMIINEGLIKYT